MLKATGEVVTEKLEVEAAGGGDAAEGGGRYAGGITSDGPLVSTGGGEFEGMLVSGAGSYAGGLTSDGTPVSTGGGASTLTLVSGAGCGFLLQQGLPGSVWVTSTSTVTGVMSQTTPSDVVVMTPSGVLAVVIVGSGAG